MRGAALAWLLLTPAGCVDTYRDYLEGLPTRERARDAEALQVVAEAYGVSANGIHVRWVVGDPATAIVDSSGTPAWGITLLGDGGSTCDSWVLFRGDADGDPVETSTAYARTAFAHEVAHCALRRTTGTGDRPHARLDWWGSCVEASPVGTTIDGDEFPSFGMDDRCPPDEWTDGRVDDAERALRAIGL